MYIVLIMFLIVLLFFCYALFKGEILYPPFIVVLMFTFCTVVGLSRYFDWKISDFSGYSTFLILLGLVSFIFAGYVAYVTAPKAIKLKSEPIVRGRIEIPIIVLWIVIFLSILNNVMFYSFLNSIARSVGLSGASLSEIINRYYNLKAYNSGMFVISGFMNILNIITNTFAILCLFVLIHNFCFRDLKKRDFLLAVIVVLDVVYSLLNSNRSDLLVMLAESVYLIYFFWNMRMGWSKSINFKIVSLGIRLLAVFIVLFLVLAVLLGRKGSISEMNIIDYITIYISSAIRNFDLFVESFTGTNAIFGKETFFPLNRLLYNFFGIGEYYSMALSFNSIDGMNIGNIYTAFRRYYSDFGILGIVILPGFLGWFFSSMYNRVKAAAKKGQISYQMILFSYLATALFYMPIEDRFFIYDLALSRIAQYILLYILFRYIVYKK